MQGSARGENGKRRARAGLAALGVTLLVTLAAVAAFSGGTSAAPAMTPASVSGSASWAYGGEGWSNNSLQLGNTTATWDASFGWTVIFTVTNSTTPDTFVVEEQRTVGITISANYAGPVVNLSYNYQADETDVAFANVTNASVVYSDGTAVAALGIDNTSARIQGAIAQSVSKTVAGATRSASLDVTGSAQAALSFAPSFGLVPLNLSGTRSWNSTSTVSGAANWSLTAAWAEQGYNGTTGSGTVTHAGNWSTAGPVSLQGTLIGVSSGFRDHQARTGVVLIVQGPFDTYDGFVFVPHAFDLFGTAQPFASMSFGSASITSGETLYLSATARGLGITAASTTFAGDDASVGGASGTAAPSAQPTASPEPGATVTGQPMSVAQAQAESACLTHGCSASATPSNGLFEAAVIGLVVAAVVGTVGVVEWRSYARRRSQKGLVGGYGESWTNGTPPPGAIPGSAQAPAPPAGSPAGPEEPFPPR